MKNFLLVICLLGSTSVFSQKSRLWDDFVAAQKNGREAILPDFSYAGYHHGEKGIPTVDYKLFNVVDFGANPNDKKSDRKAVEKAIAAAEQNGSGIIFFPKGRYYFNTKRDPKKPIVVNGNRIVFRGEGSGVDGSELFMENPMPPKNPKQMWSSPSMFKFTGSGGEPKLASVKGTSKRGSFSVQVDNTSKLKAGNWVVLKVKNPNPGLVADELCPCCADEKWTNITQKGVYVSEYHQVKKIEGNTIVFKEPIMRAVDGKYDWGIFNYAHYEEVGVEDLAFVGNWKDKFVHHASWLHDGGYKLLIFNRLANSWVRNCRFTDVNGACRTSLCANVTIQNCIITGNPGHNAISSNASTRVLIAKVDDQSSQWHAPGVAGPAIGTVLWRVKYTDKTSFETHASQPRATLFDCTEGGFFIGRGGGARHNLPNHLRDLVLWNYKETDGPDKDFEFWSSKTWFWKIIPPIVVGFHGAGTTFKEDQIQELESLGTPVKPESLYESQLELRLGKLPEWIIELKKN